MTPEQYKEFTDAIAELKTKIQAIEIQIALMDPLELIKFKVKAVQSLQVIDRDIDTLSKKLDICQETQTTFVTNYNTKMEEIVKHIAVLETKATIYAVIAASVASTLISLFLK